MAAAVAAHYAAHGLGPVNGAVVTRYGHGLRAGEQAPGIEVLEAGHPVPDAASVAAGTRILQVARSCEPDDRCLALLSGGASSLLVQPAPGLTLADKQSVTRRLLASGAAIAEINTVRRKLSSIKGGGLARQIRAGEILLLAISDVPGDALADIGSGPLSPDPASGADARAILDHYGIVPSAAVARALAAPAGPAQALPFPAVTGRPRGLLRHGSRRSGARRRRGRLAGPRPACRERARPGRRPRPRGSRPGTPGERAAGCAGLRWRDDRQRRARCRAGRPQWRVPAGARPRARAGSRHPRPGCGYRWPGWHRRQRRRFAHARYPAAGRSPGPGCRRPAVRAGAVTPSLRPSATC